MIPEIICVGREQGTGNGQQGRKNKSVLSFFQKSNTSPIAQDFINAVEDAIFRIVESPQRWPITDEDIRRCLIRKFPYGILYTIEDEYILIVAVMHCSRKPGYWQQRIKEQMSDNDE